MTNMQKVFVDSLYCFLTLASVVLNEKTKVSRQGNVTQFLLNDYFNRTRFYVRYNAKNGAVVFFSRDIDSEELDGAVLRYEPNE